MEGVRGQYFQNQHNGLKFGSLNFSDHLDLDVSSNKKDVVLNREVQKLALKDSIKGNGTVQGGLMEWEHMEHRRCYYPLRPEAENCLFFMRHGWCQFRGNCRYNHPLDRRSQADYKEIAKLNEENLNRMEQVQCKYYLTPEGCKHGKACRYYHSGPKTEKAPVFLGLPIRATAYAACHIWQQQQAPKPNWQPEPVSRIASDHVISSQEQQQHPKPHKQAERSKTSVCPVNEKGLPLRPDTEICPYYNRYRVCKRGAGCQFDHPVPRAKAEPAAESEEAQLPQLPSQTSGDNNN